MLGIRVIIETIQSGKEVDKEKTIVRKRNTCYEFLESKKRDNRFIVLYF
jgi:hypothetical protein